MDGLIQSPLAGPGPESISGILAFLQPGFVAGARFSSGQWLLTGSARREPAMNMPVVRSLVEVAPGASYDPSFRLWPPLSGEPRRCRGQESKPGQFKGLILRSF
jgi:hypothetical protein